MTSLLPPFISKANYLEVTAKHVSKEDALVELANHYHLSLEEVLTMETTSTTSLCSKSRYRGRYGQRSTRSERGATVVTKTNNENGAGQAVETYVLI